MRKRQQESRCTGSFLRKPAAVVQQCACVRERVGQATCVFVHPRGTLHARERERVAIYAKQNEMGPFPHLAGRPTGVLVC